MGLLLDILTHGMLDSPMLNPYHAGGGVIRIDGGPCLNMLRQVQPFTTGRIAWICSGPVAQQPPKICAPRSFHSRANPASRAGG